MSIYNENITDVVGSREFPATYIYQMERGTMVRSAHFHTNKGGKPIHIMQTTDLHLNCLNAKDCMEALPCILSTRTYRIAFRDGDHGAVPNAMSTMELADDFDQVIVTGDTMDYITWGTVDLIEEIIWKKHPDVLMSIGGHELTRVMQGKVPDPSTLESRYAFLRAFWRNDMYYVSKVLGNKVRCIILNNGEGKYFESQYEPLRQDIAQARKNGEIVLIFQHEPICSKNPAEADLTPMRINDGSGSRDFYNCFIGCASSDEITKKVYGLITQNADVIKGVFCGHWHSDFYSEIIGSRPTEQGEQQEIIPQYILTGNMYDKGHILIITVD